MDILEDAVQKALKLQGERKLLTDFQLGLSAEGVATGLSHPVTALTAYWIPQANRAVLSTPELEAAIQAKAILLAKGAGAASDDEPPSEPAEPKPKLPVSPPRDVPSSTTTVNAAEDIYQLNTTQLKGLQDLFDSTASDSARRSALSGLGIASASKLSALSAGLKALYVQAMIEAQKKAGSEA